MKMKRVILGILGMACLVAGTIVLAQQDQQLGIGQVAATARQNIANIARLVTAASYVAGMAFAVGAIVKFKAHKDNPTQIPIGTPIALLFVGAALIFIPTVFRVSGETLFGASGVQASISGVVSF
ncbi:MAG: type IV secretion protein IcmD [Gammaproteobacteria bacterium]|nr:type IV secretion protein IcmD [Gammaproteobacteria bacterium]MCW5582574.1 type IV secretion protein IcmD [Gammaproteobacteria bacterium]